MPAMTVRLDGTAVNGWLAELSASFPEARFRLLGSQRREGGALAILEVRSRSVTAILERFERVPEVASFEVFHADDRSAVLQFHTTATRAFDPLVRSGNASLYPTHLEDGWFTVRLVAPHGRLTRYVEELAAADIPYRVRSLTGTADVGGLLTERQRAFVDVAIGRGYYDTPRGCTLTELAESLDIHPSAASRLRHRAESRIVRSYAAESRL